MSVDEIEVFFRRYLWRIKQAEPEEWPAIIRAFQLECRLGKTEAELIELLRLWKLHYDSERMRSLTRTINNTRLWP
jgi:hypothetical protein